MKFTGFFLCLVSVSAVTAFDGRLIKHLTEPRPGGIIDTITKPKLPGVHLGGGLSFGVGSFGLNFGFNKQYTPPGTGVVLPPKEPQVPGVPDGGSYVPDVKPGFPGIPSNPVVNPYVPAGKPGYWNPNGNPYIPGYPNGGNPYIPGYPSGNPYIPGYPNGNPYVPGHPSGNPNGNPYVPGHPSGNPNVHQDKPEYPNGRPYLPDVNTVKAEVPKAKPEKTDVSWEEEEKTPYYPPRPNKSKEDKDSSKPEMYEEDKSVHSKPDSYENEASFSKPDAYEDRKDTFPDWEDIGEKTSAEDKKAEYFMNGELVADGLIQPRNNRNKRYIESRVFHVPLLFRSNAKPYQVKVESHPNSLETEMVE